MSDESPALDAATFLDVAVRENMLSSDVARAVVEQAGDSSKTPSQFLVDTGRLTPIQGEAIEGLLAPDSIAKGYQVVGLLGYGGIGIVYQARQPSLDRIVALKTISTARLAASQGDTLPTAVPRFQQEAVTVAKFKHPNIVTAYDFGADGDRLYLAMEMVEGTDLDAFVKKRRRLDETLAWRLARQVASALSHAQEWGIIHRDIKPGNLLLTEPPTGYPLPDGVPLLKVTDFGLARLNTTGLDSQETRLTVAGATMGTPHYMAPEQIDNTEVTQAADIYALGATVFQMLTGAPPFDGLSMIKVFAAKLAGEKIPLDKLPETTSDQTRDLLAAMLAPQAADRPQDYDELIVQIDRVIDVTREKTQVGATVLLEPPVAGSANDSVSLSADTVLSDSKNRRPGKAWRRRLSWAAGLAILLAPALLFLPSLTSPIPPTPRYELATSSDAEAPLFFGTSIGKWKNLGGVGIAKQPAGFLAFGNMIWRELDDAAQMLGNPDHFGLQFSVVLDEAQAVECLFDTTPTGEGPAVLIEPQRATIGGVAGQGEPFTPLDEPVALRRAATNPEISICITRDEQFWFVWQLPPGGAQRLLGALPVAADPPTEIRFRAQGGKVYLGNVLMVKLERRTEGG